MQLLQFWICGALVNIFLGYSIFLVYFQSPIVAVSRTHEPSLSFEVKRVVLLVADGLPADVFFENSMSHPRLNEIIHSDFSANGIAESRVLTMTRPGFIAFIAGIDQDPSDLFLKWKKDLFDFDSVLNRSSYNVLIGCSPNPLKQFAKGVEQQKVYSEVYEKSKNYSKYEIDPDNWVLLKFSSILESEVVPSYGKVFIVLHFKGTDTAAHVRMPHSPEHLDSIRLMDRIVAVVEHSVHNYFGDNQTVFVFTSDHGMTDDGHHGGQSLDETETPFVIWGPGINGSTDKIRIQQVDFAPFLSATLGIPFPVNSLGKFPSVVWENKSLAYDALAANWRQLNELRSIKKRVVDVGILPFLPFGDEHEINRLVQFSALAAQRQDYEGAMESLNTAFALTLSEIKYYETYDLPAMMFLTLYSLMIWTLRLFFAVLSFERQEGLHIFSAWTLFVHMLLSVLLIAGAMRRSMWLIAFALYPLYLTQLIYPTLKIRTDKRSMQGSVSDLKNVLFFVALSLVGICILALNFDKHEVLTFGVMLNGLWRVSEKSKIPCKMVLWCGSHLVLLIFPNLPVLYLSKNSVLMTLGPLTIGFLSLWLMEHNFRNSEQIRKRDKQLLSFQFLLVFSAAVLIHFPDFVITRIVALTSVLLCFMAPMLISSCNSVSLRIISLFLAISTPSCFVSVSCESLILPSIFVALYILIEMEATEENANDPWEGLWILRIRRDNACAKLDSMNSFRLIWIHKMLFIYFSFFGTGVGDLYGELGTQYGYIAPYFLIDNRPWVIWILCLVKILGPWFLLSCFYRIVTVSRQEIERNFLIVLLICQSMGIHAFLGMQNAGSWLEIQTSVSHFVIVQALTLSLSLLYWAANTFIGENVLRQAC